MRFKNDKFRKQQNWMFRNARPLELARWRYHMESKRKEEIFTCLKAFQNHDGGFGHGIEPDFWNPASTPMASWRAAQILKEIDTDPKEEIVQNLVRYLVSTMNRNTGMWSSSVPGNNDHPHAPWWHWKEDVQANWMFNPAVELSAYLIYWSQNNHDALKISWESMAKALDHLMEQTEMDRHELNNYKNAIDILRGDVLEFNRRMPHSFEKVEKKVWKLIEGCMDQSYKNWGKDYLALPLDFINHPEQMKNIQISEIESLVEKNLTFYATSLTDEGVWDITWDWDQYPEEFAVAKRIWQGILIVNRCKILKTFGVIDH